jgi:crotonobetainyl-CoA:carnitine CoA-transferase CaiB-like acyl-CoA transferase
VPSGVYLADSITGAVAFEGVLAALFHRERTGEGQLVTVNMLDAMTTLQMQELSVYTQGRVPQLRSGEPHGHVYIRAPYGTFATTDGYVALAMPDLPTLGRVLDEPAFLAMDQEVHGWTHRDEIHARTAAALARESTAHWLEVLAAAGLWVGPVYGYAELVDDPQIAHNGTFIEYEHPTEGTVTTPGYPYRFSATPPGIRRGAPLTGEHTREVLAELGVAAATVDELLRDGVVTETVA